MRYLFIDTETGGLNPKQHTLLETFFAVTDDRLNVLHSLELKTKPNDEVFVCTAEALQINRISLAEHSRISLKYKDAYEHAIDFLKYSTDGEKFIPVGHNVKFDIDFIKQNLIASEVWDQFCGYRILDTSAIAMFLVLVEKMPKLKSNSLESWATYLNVDAGIVHTAKDDVFTCINVLKKMIEITKNNCIL